MPRVLCPCGEEMQAEPQYEGAYFCLWCGTLQFFARIDPVDPLPVDVTVREKDDWEMYWATPPISKKDWEEKLKKMPPPMGADNAP